jgi:hypothetical protein
VSDEYGAADGISKEEVWLYFSATWRGKAVNVTMQASRYSASHWDERSDTSTNRLVDWRVYATDARYSEDPAAYGGESATGTARAALSALCEPMVMDWLASDAYTVSFQRAVAHLIMGKFRDDYSASRRVPEALATFRDRLPAAIVQAITETLEAYNAFAASRARTSEVISG